MNKTKAAVMTTLGLFSLTIIQGNASDITIYDKIGGVGTSGGAFGTDSRAGIFEDQEVEPGNVRSQAWDLEAFHLSGNSLSVVGGFNFMAGEGTYASGDIFIDIDGNANWGTPVSTGGTVKVKNNLFDYDYVISFGGRDLNNGYASTDQTLDGTYKVYSLTGNSKVITVDINNNNESNPWIYYSGGSQVASGNVTQSAYTGGEYAGDAHYELAGIDLSFLADIGKLDGALFKLTMECGNDNLVGRAPTSVPDAGSTAALLGLGMLSLAGIQRKFKAA